MPLPDNYYPEELRIASEEIEPAMERMIGKWFAQSEYIRKKYGPHSFQFVDILDRWWFGMQALSRLTIATRDTVHAGLFVSNNSQVIAAYIKEHLGFNPITVRAELGLSKDLPPFRSLVKFEVDFTYLGKEPAHEPA